MNPNQETPQLKGLCPFLIVDDLQETLDFYESKLGFSTSIRIPQENPFFAMVDRDRVSIMLKHVTNEIHPIPNGSRHSYADLDLYMNTYDPDSLYEEFKIKGVEFYRDLADDLEDGLRYFDVKDNNGYVLRFSRRIDNPPR